MIARMLASLVSHARAFTANDEGGVYALLGFGIIPLVAVLGLVTDAGRGYLVKSQLGQAVDAAALAGGRAMFQDYQAEDIEKYFEANFPVDFMGAQVQPLDIDIAPAGDSVEVIATAEVPTSFMRVLDIGNMTVTARAVVNRQVRGLELALVMDNTGSMRSGGKMDAMKDAATELINILYGEREDVENFYVSLIPYAAMVNIGNQREAWLQGYNPASYGATSWKGCVEARLDVPGLDSSDLPPSDGLWPPALWPSTEGVYPSTGDNDWNNGNIDEANGAQNNGLGPNLGCGPAITPLITLKSDVLTAIDGMQPWHRGGTMANLGLAWGWRTLSPEWRGLWGGDTPDFLPFDYGEDFMDKAVVLLTDGENQWYDWPGGLPGKPNFTSYPGADYTAYGRLNEERLGPGIDSNSEAKSEINDRMADLCTAMKAEGIILFTILFQVNDSATESLYEDCATSSDHFFDADSKDDLESVFQTIGTELANLRLSE